ncbi:hypothetical protein HPB47_025150 [Ixodes persulcatus]|uniref:Uncharacterized protein n=1 Tax=Ixodes persulcatus TaxID=34615 RepID=A0AC60Q426_IXOPE|nr:hypothetical protein HPB47_025150 [Ixodes persulcatus]
MEPVDWAMSMPACFQASHVDASKIPRPIPAAPTAITKAYGDVIQYLKQDKMKDAKSLVRAQHWPVDHPNRGELWLGLCQSHAKGSMEDDFYDSMVQESLGGLWPMSLPTFADPIYCEDYLLSEEGQKKAERVLYVLSVSHPYITYCPLLHPLASLFLHYLSEEKTYECISALIGGTIVRHLSQTRLMHDTSAYALMQLTKRLAKKTYLRLNRKVEKEEDLERVFHTWELWIFRGLPFYHLVRAVDCYLIEGVRALYRIAMTILILYTQENASSRDEAADPGQFLDRIIFFCQEIPFNVDKFLKTAYGIQGFSAKVLNQQLLKAEMYIRSCSSGRLRAASEGGLPLSESTYHLQITSSSLTIKEGKFDGIRAMSVGIIPLANFKSEVLNREQMGSLWSWLPPRITMLQPEVIYSTNEHGSSLTNFYFHTDTWEPTVIAILTTRDERFGAYCSTKWQERKQTYFGTGETFLFTFTPQPKRYPWVGANSASDVPHSSKLFLSANQHMIQIGAGNGFGLYIDESLENGRTERCDTFNNSPLASSNDFVIRIMEVIGFA